MRDGKPGQIIAFLDDGRLVALQIDRQFYPDLDAMVAVPRTAGWAFAAGAAVMLTATGLSVYGRLACALPLLLLACAAWWRSRSLRRQLEQFVV